MPISPIITSAGLAAVLNATNNGLSARITHVALGDTAWTPDNTATALRNERQRVTVSNGTRIQPNQIHITAVENGTVEYWIRELAFVLDDGTLLAVWSDPTQALAFKAAGVDVLLAFDLVLSALPDDSVTVVGTGGVQLPPSTEEVVGVLRLATSLEMFLGERNDVAASPERIQHHGDNRYARRAHRHVWDAIDGKPSRFTPSAHDHLWTEINHKPTTYPPSSHTHPWSQVTGKPTSFPPVGHRHAWQQINSKPTTYPPSSHSHTWFSITGKPVAYVPIPHDHDDRHIVRDNFRITNGMVRTEERMSRSNWAGFNDWDHNYVIIRPPSGYTMAHYVGFTASAAIVNFGGDVDGNDSLWCRWRRESTNGYIRVICANSENRGDASGVGSYINYMAIWIK